MNKRIQRNATAFRVIEGGNWEPIGRRDLREALELAEVWLNLPADGRNAVQSYAKEEMLRAKEQNMKKVQYVTYKTTEYNGNATGDVDDPYIWIQHLKKTATYDTIGRLSVWTGIGAEEIRHAKQLSKRIDNATANLHILEKD